MKCTLLALIVATFTFVSAEIKITNPVPSTSWKFGTTQTVQWTTTTETGPIDLYLFYLGDSDPKAFQAKEYVVKVAVPDVSDGSAKVDLTTVKTAKYPPSSNKYFIRIGNIMGGYSSQFTITGGTGSAASAATSASASTSISTTTSASASISILATTSASAATFTSLATIINKPQKDNKESKTDDNNGYIKWLLIIVCILLLLCVILLILLIKNRKKSKYSSDTSSNPSEVTTANNNNHNNNTPDIITDITTPLSNENIPMDNVITTGAPINEDIAMDSIPTTDISDMNNAYIPNNNSFSSNDINNSNLLPPTYNEVMNEIANQSLHSNIKPFSDIKK